MRILRGRAGGPLVLDIGCYCNPVTNWLDMVAHRLILLDISEVGHDLSELTDFPLTVFFDLCSFDQDSNDFWAFDETFCKTKASGLDAIISATISSFNVQSIFNDDLEYLIAEYGSQQGSHEVAFEKIL